MNKYEVYFEQINQDRIQVEADNEGEARAKARDKWKSGWLPANITSVIKINAIEPVCENCGCDARNCDCWDNSENMQKVIAWRLSNNKTTSKCLEVKQ